MGRHIDLPRLPPDDDDRGPPVSDEIDLLVAEQIRYYEARAPEYEDLWHRQGRYDLGPEGNARWFRETAKVEAAVDGLDTRGSVLEVACGSGLWTRRLAPRASRYVGIDASPAMLALNRVRTAEPRVEYVEADVFSWDTDERFDLVFMGFFLSHVPPERFAAWWTRVRSWLGARGSVFLCDDAVGPNRPYSGDRVPGGPDFARRRRLPGGRQYEIVMVFYEPRDLEAKLEVLGWTADVRSTGENFLLGTARPNRSRLRPEDGMP